jgi:membrane-bound ClpP family serine protease
MFDGELWDADTAGEAVEVGEKVRVLAMEGLRLKVEKA